jgi:hypothetical protein
VITPDLSKLKDYEYPDIAKRFYKETQGHRLTILHDDGLYRHLRMRNPKDSAFWYDLITWEGNLVFRGDGTSYAFARDPDMFEFFRRGFHGGQIHVNADYWAEKLTSDRDSVHGYQDDLFEKRLQEFVDEYAEDMDEETEKRFREAVKDHLELNPYQTANDAIRTLDEFEFYTDESKEFDYKHQADVTFDESWEWVIHCKKHEWWFVWALYGIVHAIHEYDRIKGELSGDIVKTDTEIGASLVDITTGMRVLR